MQSRGFALGKNGQPYDKHYAQIFRLRDGLVVEWIEYLDTAMLARTLDE
jgi:ketosteroid isomerase-like protein